MPVSLAQENPDVLSDEQVIWEDRSEENENTYELAMLVKSFLHKLTPLQTRVISMLLAGHKYKEIARVLKLSVGNVSTLQKRAENKIRKLVGKEATLPYYCRGIKGD